MFSAAKVYDDHIAFTAEYLPAGTYELTYTLMILQAGEYQVLPARGLAVLLPRGTRTATWDDVRDQAVEEHFHTKDIFKQRTFSHKGHKGGTKVTRRYKNILGGHVVAFVRTVLLTGNNPIWESL